MKHRILLPLLATLLTSTALAAAEAHGDHDGHDHAPAKAAEPKKTEAHAEHGAEGKADEHGEEHVDEVHLSAAVATSFGIVSETVKLRALSALIRAPGWVTYDPAGQAHVTASSAGRIVTIHVKAGDQVKAGDPLVEIHSPALLEAQSAYLLKRAAIGAADLRIETAQEILLRGQQASAGITGAELKRRETELKQAQMDKTLVDAEVAAALAAVRLLGPSAAELDALVKNGTCATTLTLHAPLSGTIIERSVVLGQQVDSDTPALLNIADTSRLWVVAHVPEAQLAKIGAGSLAELYGFDGSRLGDADILSMSPDVDPHTRTGLARIPIAGNAQIRPGIYVQVRITPLKADIGAKVIAVPEASVMNIEGRPGVFVSEGAGDELHFRVQAVSVGPAMHGFVPVLSGLETGVQVVVQGAFLLKAELGKEGAAHEH